MYLTRHKNLETVRLGVWECCNVICANLAETTQVDNSSSEHVTARNNGCLDPFSDLYAEVISACWPTGVFAPYDIRYHRIFGRFHGCHGRRTARTGLPRAGWIKCNLTGCWDVGRLTHPQIVNGGRAKIFIHSYASLGRSDNDDEFQTRSPATPFSSRLLYIT